MSTDNTAENGNYNDPVTGRFTKDNPGRPKGSLSLIGLLKNKLEEVEPHTKRTYAELLIERMTKMAVAEGSESQIRNILQYVEGMPKQSVEVDANIKQNYDPKEAMEDALLVLKASGLAKEDLEKLL